MNTNDRLWLVPLIAAAGALAALAAFGAALGA
jgi:hypothetical protein